jgi:exodeoxyribonuclease III
MRGSSSTAMAGAGTSRPPRAVVPTRSPESSFASRSHDALGVLTLNVGAAAPWRATQILAWLGRRPEDVIVLSETSAGAGTALLRSGLERRGYSTHFTSDARDRGVLVASRLRVVGILEPTRSVTLPCRAIGVVLDTRPQVALLGVYVPSRDRSPAKVLRKQHFIESLLRSLGALPERLRRRLLIAGDLNVVPRHHVPKLPGFFPYEYELHERLEQLGLRAAHELLRPEQPHPHSWIGRTGLGYLYDYVHVGRGLHDRVERCAYLHGPRTRRLSDHAAVAARVRLG